MKKPKRVLVAPLNWGLGHATRCIPIINELLKNGFEVVLASDGRALQLLQKEFPQLQIIELPTYNIQYPSSNMMFNIAFQIYKILIAIWKEHHFIGKLVKKEKIDAILSDNRYGCRSRRVKSIFITHQINIIIPLKPLEWLVNKINHILINHFDECWVPDFEEENNLAGQLSEGTKIKKVKYLGLLSRMRNLSLPKKYEIVAIISGPEPQRTYFEKTIIKELKPLEKRCLIVQGRTETEDRFYITPNLEVIAHLTANELNEAIESSELVICRSGYSSIMDLVALKKQAILIPTPGQTEQEYLANRLKNNGCFSVQDQASFSLKKVLQRTMANQQFQSKGIGQNQMSKIILTLKN